MHGIKVDCTIISVFNRVVMARVTVEDCLVKVKNRFELAILAGFRAQEISKGSDIRVSRDKDKDAVVALREIAAGKIDIAGLEKTFIASLRKSAQADDILEEDTLGVKAGSNYEETAFLKANNMKSAPQDLEEDFVSIEDYDFEEDTSAED